MSTVSQIKEVQTRAMADNIGQIVSLFCDDICVSHFIIAPNGCTYVFMCLYDAADTIDDKTQDLLESYNYKIANDEHRTLWIKFKPDQIDAAIGLQNNILMSHDRIDIADCQCESFQCNEAAQEAETVFAE